MKILHTSDWHLGKTLEGRSRLEEQQRFLADFVQIVKEKEVDLVIISGDIYDTFNPPARAEELFYNTLRDISNNGQTGILVIAGNHDSPRRLTSIKSLARKYGVILLGKPRSQISPGQYGEIEVLESEPGYLNIEVKGEEAVVITLPYPNEKRLDEIFTYHSDEKVRVESYRKKLLIYLLVYLINTEKKLSISL